MSTIAAQFRTGDTDRRARRQSSSRIDFAPPMCALPHSTTDSGRPISRFSEADAVPTPREEKLWERDRKSTRLNSSHGYISYAVFCLKKKKKKNEYISETILR